MAKLVLLTSFDLESVDRRSRNFHQGLTRAYPPLKFRVSSFSGSRDSRGIICLLQGA